MTLLAQVDQALRSIIAARRLGQPVFVRCLIQGSAIGTELEQFLLEVTGLIRVWLNQPVQCLYALQSNQSGEVTLSLRFEQGATAIVSYHHCLQQDKDIDIMVLGSRGTAYYQGSFANSYVEEIPFLPTSENLRPEATPILGALQRSLRSRQPESVLAEPPS